MTNFEPIVDNFVFGTGTEDPVVSQRQLNLLPLSNFVGGLNLANADTALFDNESSDLCNIDINSAGGFCSRHPVRMHTREDLPSQICNLIQWQDEDGEPILYIVLEDGSIWYTEGSAIADATPVLAPFATPGSGSCEGIQIGFNQYFYGIDGDAVCVEDGPEGTVTTVPWQTIDAIPGRDPDCNGDLIAIGCDDNGDPDFTDEQDFIFGFPRAECMTVHGDFAWAANVTDPVTGEVHCNRVYRSFPLFGDASTGQVWGSEQYIDINPTDGDCITNIISCGPTLYVFKNNSVYILSNIDDTLGASIVASSICTDVGTPGCSTAVCCECVVYFWDEKRGLYAISGTQVQHIFGKLEALIREGCIRSDCAPAVGCCNGRIFVSVAELPVTPELEDQAEDLPTDCTNTTTYVLTPESETWVKHTYGIDRYLDWRPREGKCRCLGASSVGGNFSVVELERPGYNGVGVDVFSNAAGPQPIESFWRSKWFDGGNPFSNKEWARPYILAQATEPAANGSDFDLNVTYLADWCVDQTIGGGTVSFFGDLAEDAVPEPPKFEIVEQGGEALPVCFDGVEVSDQTCPVSNAKKEKQCAPDYTSKSCSMQIVITGPTDKPWCVCFMMIGYTEEVFRP